MEDIRMELPPGFRFHPTDEELITYYLSKKILDSNFSTEVMGQVDLNMVEPWDLPSKTKTGETEWYFFCVKDKKYPTGLRTNRATVAGYWKATGKDKEIFQAKTLIGMKKTLVFYKGRAPRGEKTNWIMHEYRLEGKIPLLNHPSAAKSDWVICRVFEKGATGKKIHYSGLASLNSIGNGSSSVLPPLTDCSPSSVSETVHGSRFSNPIEAQKKHQGMAGYVNNSLFGFSSNPMGISLPNMCNSNQVTLQFPSSVPIQDHAFLKGLMENDEPNFRQIPKTEDGVISISQETGLSNDRSSGISSVVSNVDFGRSEFEDYEAPSALVAASEFDYIWNY